MMEAEIRMIVGFEDGGRDLKPEKANASENWKCKETDSLLGPPEGTQSCQHLDFSSLRPRL